MRSKHGLVGKPQRTMTLASATRHVNRDRPIEMIFFAVVTAFLCVWEIGMAWSAMA